MRPTTDSRGFTLVEMLVALALGTLVMTFMFSTFFRSQRATQGVQDLMENRQNARTAVQLLERDLRMAGSGWSRIPVEGCYNGSAITIYPVTSFYGGTPSRNDTIGIIGSFDTGTTLSASMALKTSSMKVASVAGFSTNDFVVVTNGTNAHLFQVTGIKSTAPVELYHATTSVYNVSGGHQNWPSGGYSATNGFVYRVSWISYKVDTTNSKHWKLVRREANQTPQLVAYDVKQFKVNYLLQDETETRDPDDPDQIDRLIPMVSMSATLPGKGAMTDSASTEIRPRSF